MREKVYLFLVNFGLGGWENKILDLAEMEKMGLDVISLSRRDVGFWAHHFKHYGPLPYCLERLGPTTLSRYSFPVTCKLPKTTKGLRRKPHEMDGHFSHFE